MRTRSRRSAARPRRPRRRSRSGTPATIANDMKVSETHDLRVGLSTAVEELSWVERCFVTIDDQAHADLDRGNSL